MLLVKNAIDIQDSVNLEGLIGRRVVNEPLADVSEIETFDQRTDVQKLPKHNIFQIKHHALYSENENIIRPKNGSSTRRNSQLSTWVDADKSISPHVLLEDAYWGGQTCNIMHAFAAFVRIVREKTSETTRIAIGNFITGMLKRAQIDFAYFSLHNISLLTACRNSSTTQVYTISCGELYSNGNAVKHNIKRFEAQVADIIFLRLNYFKSRGQVCVLGIWKS